MYIVNIQNLRNYKFFGLLGSGIVGEIQKPTVLKELQAI